MNFEKIQELQKQALRATLLAAVASLVISLLLVGVATNLYFSVGLPAFVGAVLVVAVFLYYFVISRLAVYYMVDNVKPGELFSDDTFEHGDEDNPWSPDEVQEEFHRMSKMLEAGKERDDE